MLTSMQIINNRNVTLTLPIASSAILAASLQIHDIQGLGPVKADVNTSSYAGLDGEVHLDSKVGKRNITFKLGFNPNYQAGESIESLRMQLYQFLVPKAKITLRFNSTHMPTVDIQAIVESCDPNKFSQDPEMVVSVICPQPEFTATAATVLYGSSGTPQTINYAGTTPTGYTLQLTTPTNFPTSVYHQIVVSNQAPEYELFLFEGIVLQTTEAFYMSTIRGGKVAGILNLSTFAFTPQLWKQGGKLTNPGVGYQWPQLKPGDNIFSATPTITVPTAASCSWTLTYNAAFAGL